MWNAGQGNGLYYGFGYTEVDLEDAHIKRLKIGWFISFMSVVYLLP